MFWTSVSLPCFKEIFGGSRGDMYTLSSKTSPVSNPNNFRNTVRWSVSWKMITFDRVWKNANVFSIAKLMSTQHAASWSLFRALCRHCAWRGTFKSITSGSLWLSIGSTSRKNTVFCSKFGIQILISNRWKSANWRHIRHGKMYWKKLLWITTLSCDTWSIKLRPECPWRPLKYTIVPEKPVHYWNLLWFPPPAKHTFHLLSDQWRQYKKYLWIFSVIFQNWTAPSSSRCTFSEWRRRHIIFFDSSSSEKENVSGSTSVQVLFSIRTILGEEPANSILCCFPLAFDQHAKSFATSFNAYDSSWTPGIYVSFCSNSPQTYSIHVNFWHKSEYCLRIKTKFWSQPIFAVQKIWLQLLIRAQSLCFPGSIHLVVTIQNQLEECIPDKPLNKTVKYLEGLSSWNTVRFQQHSGILHPYKICSICLVVTASQFVVRILAIEDLCEQCHHNGTRLPHHSGSLRSFAKGFILFTFLRDCSVKTELIYRSNCPKNSCNNFQIGRKVYRQFTMSIAFELTSENGLVARKIRHPLSANSANIFSAILSHSPYGLSSLIQYHFFSEPRQINDHFSFSKSPCVQRYEFGICQAFFFVVFWSTRDVIEHRHKYDSSCEILASHLIPTVNVWLLHWAATFWILGNNPLEFHWLAVDSVKVTIFWSTF